MMSQRQPGSFASVRTNDGPPPAASRAYGARFFDDLRQGADLSAQAIVPIALELAQPSSVVDVGCGTGEWLRIFLDSGIADVVGIDGDYVRPDWLVIPPASFRSMDLARPFTLGRTFDLAMSLEVAEHLPASSAEGFVDSLVGLAPVLLFSAAIPGQPGINHVNPRPQSYWVELFQRRGFEVIDVVRPSVWDNPTVEPWYAQNTLFFVRCDVLDASPRLQAARGRVAGFPLDIVHPGILRLVGPDAMRTRDLLAAVPPAVGRAIRRALGQGGQHVDQP